ncbi:Serine/threonine-protein kinase B [compost metagenome]
MNSRLQQYLDDIFSRYEDIKQIKELKEELSSDLQEKLDDLQKEGFDEDVAYQRTIESIGEISELINNINASTTKLQQIIGIDFSKKKLENSDLRSVQIHDGKFNYSNLQNSDFRYSDLTNSTFKCSNLDRCNFDGANLTGAKIIKSNLKGASFKDSVLDYVDFGSSDLSGNNMDNLTFNRTIFKYTGLKGTSFRSAVFNQVDFNTEVKKAIFDGATMDKGTYAILKGFKADLTNVTVL